MIDLHTHSTFSDGSLTPDALAESAARAGLTALALTDHDTTAGIAPFLNACEQRHLWGIPGVEISVDVPKGTLHMLGYFVDTSNARLQAALLRIRNGREDRNQVMLEKLKHLGMPLDWNEVAAYAGEDVVGRPHFAMAMLAHGYVASKSEAFDRFLGKGRPAYADRFRLSPEESVGMIVGAGGVAALAHPFTLDLSPTALKRFVGELARLGLGGIEVYYSEHSPAQLAEYGALADTLGLTRTGGTDFHGALNPDVSLGRGFGGLKVPDELADALARRAGVARPT